MNNLNKNFFFSLLLCLTPVFCVLWKSNSLYAISSNPEIVIHFLSANSLYDDTPIDAFGTPPVIASTPPLPIEWTEAGATRIWQIIVKPFGEVVVTLEQYKERMAPPLLVSYEFSSLKAYNAAVKDSESIKISARQLANLRRRAQNTIYLYNAEDMNSDNVRFALNKASPLYPIMEAKLNDKFRRNFEIQQGANLGQRPSALSRNSWVLDSIQLGEIEQSRTSQYIHSNWIGIFKPISRKNGGPKAHGESINYTFETFEKMEQLLKYSENLTLFRSDFKPSMVHYLYIGDGDFKVNGLMPDSFAKERHCAIPFALRKTGSVSAVD